MKTLRWIIFIPAGFAALAIGQVTASILAQKLPGMALSLVLLIFGWLWIGLAAISVFIAPSRKVGGIILATLFVVLEITALTINPPVLTGNEWAARVWTDFGMLIGIVAAAFTKDR